MELKLFGKKIFEFTKNKGQVLVYNSLDSLEKSKFLPDFHTFRANNNSDFGGFVTIDSLSAPKQEPKPKKGTEFSPKKVYELRLLNDDSFKLNVDPAYVEGQLQQFKDKLNLISLAEYDISRGTNEIASILARLENRKKYPKFEGFFNDFPYTTTSKIDELLEKHDYLQLGKVEAFLADMPKDATETMKEYTNQTQELCGKKPIFYIIASKEDFKKVAKRRDPILLAQSPFGHVWQILGAWDKEMLFLEEL